MTNQSIKRPARILHDDLVKVGKFKLPADLMILDYEVDVDVPIILGKLFLATKRPRWTLKEGT